MAEKNKYDQVRKHDAAPPAGPMRESLRDLGYSADGPSF